MGSVVESSPIEGLWMSKLSGRKIVLGAAKQIIINDASLAYMNTGRRVNHKKIILSSFPSNWRDSRHTIILILF